MADLFNDLADYADELYTNRDLKAGVKLVAEVSGVLIAAGTLLTLLTVWLPAVGLRVSALTVAQIMIRAGEAYTKLDEKERKQVRAAISWIKRGFTLGSRLIG